MTTLRPSLDIDNCYSAHVEPWFDAEDIADLWFFEAELHLNVLPSIFFKGVHHLRPADLTPFIVLRYQR